MEEDLLKNDNIKNEEISTIKLFETKKDMVEPKKHEEEIDDNIGIVVYKVILFATRDIMVLNELCQIIGIVRIHRIKKL